MNIFNRTIALLLLLSLTAACNWFDDPEENPNPEPEDRTLIRYSEHKTLDIKDISFYITGASILYPALKTELDGLIEEVKHPVTVYTLNYTTKFQGRDIEASGLVAIPNSAEVTFPVMSYQNGTNTLHSEAPSKNPDNELFILLETIASTGFVVVLPDYLGFGASDTMFHPYLHKESTVETVTDMIRAVKELCNNHLSTKVNDDLFLAGYSQGGWATMQTQKAIEQKYADEFNLKASACGAGPYDLKYINNYILGLNTYPMPYFIGYIFNSYFNLGISKDLAPEVFNTPYDTLILKLYDGQHSGAEINQQLTVNIAELFTDNYIQHANTDEKYAPLMAILQENSVEAWKTTTPTLILHGANDEFVPPAGSNKIVQEFRDKGVGTEMVTLKSIPGASHTSGIISSGLFSINWLIKKRDAVPLAIN